MALSRTDKLIHFLLRRVPGAGRTQVLKFLYLADLEARQYLGRPLSDLEYVWHDYGPFSASVYEALDRLASEGYIESHSYTAYGGTGYAYQVVDGKTVDYGLSKAEMGILNHVAGLIETTPLRELLDDVVYETAPMRDAKERAARGCPLRMELVDGQLREQGLDLEGVWAAAEEADAGKLTPHDEVFPSLRARRPDSAP